MSRLKLLGEKLSQEDVNQKLLRSLSPEWITHVVVWRNKADLETMSMDDLYNNLKMTWKRWIRDGNGHVDYEGQKESTRGSVHVETPASTALVSCDGLGGYNWSDQAEEGPNYALMAYTSSTFDSKSVEERLELFKKNEFIYLEDIKVLKVEIQMKDIAIKELRKKLEVAQKEKDGIQLIVDKLENASKSLNKLIDCQIVDNCKKGLDEFANKPVDENTKTSEEETKAVRKNVDAIIIEKWVCLVTILNTKDHLGKFVGKADEGFFVGYSLNSKAFRVFNSRTRIVEENFHIRFSEYTPNAVGTQSNGFVGIKASNNAGQARKETKPVKDYILLPLWNVNPPFSLDPKSSHDDGFKPSSDDEKKVDEDPSKGNECYDQEKEHNINITNNINIVSSTINVAGINEENELPFDPDMLGLEDVGTFDFSNENEDNDTMADMNNLDTTIQVSPTPTTRIHKDHPLDQVIEDLQSATQTRNMTKNLKKHRFVRIKSHLKAVGITTAHIDVNTALKVSAAGVLQ
nr:retrovirus-related Pol polyprotein from transposon TNT 1-94 [Tanacetum cinerariifolium]